MALPPRRIVLWFRNDLRVRDNAIVHQAVQKLQAKEFDEVRHYGSCGRWIDGSPTTVTPAGAQADC
jgi:hypothetical protein